MKKNRAQEIACQQVLVEDNSVFSIQWTDLPLEIAGDLTAVAVMERYLLAVRRMSAGFISPSESEDGVSFMLMGWLPVLQFLPPATSTGDEGESVTLRICGGLLVQQHQCHRGEMCVTIKRLSDCHVRVILRLADYCPLILGSSRPSALRRWLYRLTQAAIHRLVTIRFLVILYRELGGKASCIKTRTVSIREGRET